MGELAQRASSVQSLIDHCVESIEHEWDGQFGRPHPSSEEAKGQRCFALGQRLGELRVDARDVVDVASAKLEALQEKERILAEGDLAQADDRLLMTLSIEIPSAQANLEVLEKERSDAAKALELEGGETTKFGIYLYPILALAPLVAEFALAWQVTQDALALQQPWLFAIALSVASALVFKLIADARLSGQDGGSGAVKYRRFMIAMLVALLVPLSFLRTEVIADSGSSDFRSQVREVLSKQKATSGGDQENDSRDHRPEAGLTLLPSGSIRFFLLFIALLSAGFLFPMLSGLTFQLGQKAVSAERAARRRKERFVRASASVERQREEISGLIEQGLKSSRVIAERVSIAGEAARARRISALVGKLRKVFPESESDPELQSAGQAAVDSHDRSSVESFIAICEARIASKSRPGEDLAARHCIDSLRHLVDNSHVSVEEIGKALLNRFKGEIQAGFKCGVTTGFEIFDDQEIRKLVRDVDLRKYHARVLTGDYSSRGNRTGEERHEGDDGN